MAEGLPRRAPGLSCWTSTRKPWPPPRPNSAPPATRYDTVVEDVASREDVRRAVDLAVERLATWMSPARRQRASLPPVQTWMCCTRVARFRLECVRGGGDGNRAPDALPNHRPGGLLDRYQVTVRFMSRVRFQVSSVNWRKGTKSAIHASYLSGELLVVDGAMTAGVPDPSENDRPLPDAPSRGQRPR